MGGAFTTLGGKERNYIGRLNANGGVDNTFNPGANGDVYALALQADGKILVGGRFALLGGGLHMGIGRVQANGSVDGTFNSATDMSVYSLVVQAERKHPGGGRLHALGRTTSQLPRAPVCQREP